MHTSLEAMVIIDRVMQRLAIVPECYRPRLPSKATCELWFDLMIEEELEPNTDGQKGQHGSETSEGFYPSIYEQWRALVARPSVETFRMRNVHVYALLSGLWMSPYCRMVGYQILCLVSRILDSVLPRFGGVGFGGGVDSCQR
jgi:hypothetical protein